MRIAIGCDHAGLELKETIVRALEADGHDVLDLGTFSTDAVDYPDFARAVGQAILRGFVEVGVLVCGSGVGASIAANKLRGIRAALCHDLFTARQSREDDDANLLCLGARVLDAETAVSIARAWLRARFSGEERHVRRVAKITQLESGLAPAERPGTALRPGAPAAAPPAAPPESARTDPAGAARPTPAPPAATEPIRREAPPARPAGVTREATAAPSGRGTSDPRPAQLGQSGAPAEPTPRPESPRTAPASPAATPIPPRPTPPRLDTPLAERASALIQQVTGEAGDQPGSAEPEGVISLEEASEEPVVEPIAKPLMRAAPETRAAGVRPAASPAPPAQSPASDPFRLGAVEEALRLLESQDFVDRLWIKDGTLWKGDAAAIRNRLGWLTSPTIMREHAVDIKAFADEIRRLQFTHVVLLGMGGSSLCPEVLGLTFGSKMGFPDLIVLDSTDPAAVKQILDRVGLSRTLFLVSTKSGTTTETLSFYAFFGREVEQTKPTRPGMQFVAITDPGSHLEQLAMEAGFRRTFLNPASIGGRYSALSFFGLVPGALLGVDIKIMLERAQRMVEACGPETGVRDNPAVRLGAALAGLAKMGRDKVTFVFSRAIARLGAWIEQLIAESLGKEGTGILPVDGEPLGAPAVYGDDRVFVAIILEGDDSHDLALATLAEAGHPVLRFTLKDPLDLGAEFFRWELATAAAGAVLGVNPFDEPDVARAKDRTAELLAGLRKTRRLPAWPVDCEDDGIALMTNKEPKVGSVTGGIAAHLALARPGDYLAIQAYLTPHAESWGCLQELRTLLRDRLRIATTVAYGPRYLHSTGQLHKGGPATGLFIQLTGEDKEDLAIPGAGYGFSTLKAAQALGDLGALADSGRRVIRIHLTGKQAPALERLTRLARSATRTR